MDKDLETGSEPWAAAGVEGCTVLSDARERQRLAFELCPEAMSINRLSDGVYLDINQRFSELFGHGRDDVLGGSSLFFNLWAESGQYERFTQALRAAGRLEGFQGSLLHRDGSRRQGEISARIANLDGEPCVVSVFREMSHPRHAGLKCDSSDCEYADSDHAYRLLVDSAFEGIAVIRDERICFANPRFTEICGYSREELAHRSIFELIHPEERGKSLLRHKRRLSGERMPATYDIRGLCKSGQEIWLLVNAESIEWCGELAVLVCISDISRQKRAEEALRKSQMLYQAIVEDQTELVCRFSPDTRLTFINDAFARFFGCAKDELLGMRFLDLVPEADQEDLSAYLAGFCRERPSNCLEHCVLSTNGRKTWLQRCDRALLDDDGQIIEFQCVGRDTTKRRLYEEQIVKSLQEKEILLREIHHRVKNNLQIISSLLHLQAATDQSGAHRDLFVESQNRILTMALVHEELYRSDDLASIDLLAYMRKLLDRLLSAMGDRRKIQGMVDGESVALTIDAAIPSGLIVNELVTNSFKHAFGHNAAGRISISVSRSGERAILEISDTGRGLPEGYDFRTAKSLGLQLVVRLVKQLHGSIELVPGAGTHFRLNFPVR
ncbi:PAS domain S-box [Desulfocurvibacter africanus PCS]|uniref:PAS domain S-box n=1 Tax=Desulfocurvibacter africanus PCS TaxID=1262666 RepID=M5PP96_DESAF|nr:PAS domain S-box protein [Desulfocurvibacter africanus]EMG36062.1 PAS domain S-box [Desulfocurvibacter africanus PCS]